MTAAGSVCRSPAHAIVFCAWTAAISSTCGIPGSRIFKSATIIICWPTHPIGWKNARCCFGNTKHWWWTRHTSSQMPRGRCTRKLCLRRIFDAYTAGQTFQQIADALSAQGIPYRSDASRWNKNMVSRILANADYCGTAEYPQIITAGQLEAAEQIRKSKTVTYLVTLKPFRKDMQCGCCGARLYWHSKSNQWFCRECGMWSKPTQAKETFNSIVEKLRWLQQNSELIHPPAGKANVQSMEIVLLDREIGQVLLDAEPDADALITKILNRAELEYEFCSAGDADPATMQIRKACAEYKPTDGFPHTFYKEVVSKVILYRDTHIEFKLQNGQIV